MTSADELILKNPDALLNGEAIKQVISSCIPEVKRPELLLTNDIDLLLIIIRKVSYGDKFSITADCPECKIENTFNVDLDGMVANVTHLADNYPINLASGATVFVKPFTFQDSIKAANKSFEQNKALTSLQDESIPDAEKLKLFSKSFKALSKLNYELLVNSIIRIVDDEKDMHFENTKQNHKFTNEMLHNIDIDEARKIDDKIKEINDIGVNKDLTIKCQSETCNHEWTTELDLNPINFFSQLS